MNHTREKQYYMEMHTAVPRALARSTREILAMKPSAARNWLTKGTCLHPHSNFIVRKLFQLGVKRKNRQASTGICLNKMMDRVASFLIGNSREMSAKRYIL